MSGYPDAARVTFHGVLAGFCWRVDRRGRAWAAAVVETARGDVPVQVPPWAYLEVGARLVEGESGVFSGVVDRRGDAPVFTVTGVLP